MSHASAGQQTHRRGAPTSFAVSALFGAQRFTPRGGDAVDGHADGSVQPAATQSLQPAEDAAADPNGVAASGEGVPTTGDPTTREGQAIQQRFAFIREKQLSLKNRLLRLTEKDEAAAAGVEAAYAEREPLETDVAALTLRADSAAELLDTWEGKMRTADGGVKHLRERALANDVAFRSGLKRMKEILEKRKKVRAEINAGESTSSHAAINSALTVPWAQ